MSTTTLKPWVESVTLHPDVLAENFSEDIFALDLGPLSDDNPQVPAVYRDPEHFFRSSYLTNGLRSLLQDVLSRLDGGSGNRVLKLMTAFGGGKSHTLAAVYHAARNRKALDVIPEGQAMPRPGKARTAVFDGQFFSAVNGKTIPACAGALAGRPGTKNVAKTMWGWIAWSLGQEAGYEIMRQADEAKVAPGGDDILKLLGDVPNLILLDEVLEYLISAGGIKVGDTTLRDETLNFIKRLTTAVGSCPKTALVFSLQSSKRESLEYINLLQTLDHLAARKDQRREPVEGNEILLVIQRRLLGKMPEAAVSAPVAAAYQEIVTQMRRAYAKGAAEQQQAEQEGIELRDRVRAAYPFHPALIDLMRERWAAIPEFQRTRGALRFLAACLRSAHQSGTSPACAAGVAAGRRAVLGPGDVPMHDPAVRLAFFKEVGQQADFQAVLEHDLIGANARARRIDERRAKEFPAEALKRPATRIATAIMMYSFGGKRRLSASVQAGEGATEAELLPPGISEAELLAVCVGPDLDSTTVLACLKELKDQCLYLHFDGVRYCFKKDPNVTLLVEQEADAVGRDEAQTRDKIKEMLEARLAGHRVEIWPTKSGEIPDKEPAFLIAYLPLEFGAETKAEQQRIGKELLEKFGDKPRQFRNGLGLAIPSSDQIEVLRRAVRYLLAIERVKGKAKQLNLTDEQKIQLREREATEKAAAESAFLKLYTQVWLPKVDLPAAPGAGGAAQAGGSGIGIDLVAVGGRPLQTTLNEKKEARIHERVLELLTFVQPRVFDKLTPTKIVELFKLGDLSAARGPAQAGGTPPTLGTRTIEIVNGFYSFLGFTRLINSGVIRRAIVRGVKEGVFGYTSGAVPALGPDGKYQVALDKVRFEMDIAEDEVDLEAGFIMVPQAIPQAAPVTPPTAGGQPGQPPPPGPGPTPVTPGTGTGPSVISETPTSAAGAAAQKVVDLKFTADRDGLFAAWNALANLADMSGKVTVNVHAEAERGFDKSKLQNGVLEPLKEADLIQ